jgi:hypothetical protein
VWQGRATVLRRIVADGELPVRVARKLGCRDGHQDLLVAGDADDASPGQRREAQNLAVRLPPLIANAATAR